MIEFKRTSNSIEIIFLIFKLGILRESDHHGPFILVSFLIWRLGTTVAFTYYEKQPKGWTTVGES